MADSRTRSADADRDAQDRGDDGEHAGLEEEEPDHVGLLHPHGPHRADFLRPLEYHDPIGIHDAQDHGAHEEAGEREEEEGNDLHDLVYLGDMGCRGR